MGEARQGCVIFRLDQQTLDLRGAPLELGDSVTPRAPHVLRDGRMFTFTTRTLGERDAAASEIAVLTSPTASRDVDGFFRAFDSTLLSWSHGTPDKPTLENTIWAFDPTAEAGRCALGFPPG